MCTETFDEFNDRHKCPTFAIFCTQVKKQEKLYKQRDDWKVSLLMKKKLYRTQIWLLTVPPGNDQSPNETALAIINAK